MHQTEMVWLSGRGLSAPENHILRGRRNGAQAAVSIIELYPISSFQMVCFMFA